LILALAAKQSSVVLLPLVLISDLTTKRLNQTRAWKVYAPLLAITLGYVLARRFYFGELGDLEGRGSTLEWKEYALTQGLMILQYLRLLVLPTRLTIDHLFLPTDFPLWQTALSWIFILIVTFTAILILLKKNNAPLLRWCSFCWLFFLICLFPTSSLLPTVDLFVERRAYMAAIGLFVGLGGAGAVVLARGSRWLKISTAHLLVAALAAQIVLTQERHQVYSSTETLWQEAIALNPQNVRAQLNLVTYYSSIQNYISARQLLDEMLSRKPDDPALLSKLGYIYMQPDYKEYDPNKALVLLEQSLKGLPDNIFALYNAGMLYLGQRRYQEAERLFMRATELNPLMAIAFVRAGEAALGLQKNAEAKVRFQRALQLDGTQMDAFNYLQQLRSLESTP